MGREKEEVGTGLQGLGMGTGGTLFRGDLQVQVMQKSIKEARQSLPLAEGGRGDNMRWGRGVRRPLIPHSWAPAPTPNPDNRAKKSMLYKTGQGQGPVPGEPSAGRRRPAPG